jgi:hypothetical protein
MLPVDLTKIRAEREVETRLTPSFTVIVPPNNEIGPLMVAELAIVTDAVLVVFPIWSLEMLGPTERFAVVIELPKPSPKESIAT